MRVRACCCGESLLAVRRARASNARASNASTLSPLHSRRTIYSEAFEKVQQDPIVSYALGSPMKAYGTSRGDNRGRRNEMERWELVEPDGEEVSVVRFTVAGPQGMGIVQTQTPKSRRRGEFKYIIFQHPPSRKTVMVLDNRGEKGADAKADKPVTPTPIAPAPAAPAAAPAAA